MPRPGLLTPADARDDPAHDPWFALVHAIEVVRREPCARNREAVAAAYEDLATSMAANGVRWIGGIKTDVEMQRYPGVKL